MKNKSMRVCTHSGAFHADDVLAVAILKKVFGGVYVLRTRDPKLLEQADIVVDVGDQYSPGKMRFDHHQKGFSLSRENGTPYAAAGLVWKSLGEEYVRTVTNLPLGGEDMLAIAEEMDRSIIEQVDAVDNGMSPAVPLAGTVSGMVWNMNPTWNEMDDVSADEKFMAAVDMVTSLLDVAVAKEASDVYGDKLVRTSEAVKDGKVLVLSERGLDFSRVVSTEMPDVLLVAFPNQEGDCWMLQTVPKVPGSFESRMEMPAEWGGLRGQDLASASGVKDAVFCHKGLFIAGAETKEGCLDMASKVLSLKLGADVRREPEVALSIPSPSARKIRI